MVINTDNAMQSIEQRRTGTVMMSLLASVCGIGYIKKGGGTIAAAVFAICWWLSKPSSQTLYVVVLLVAVIGIWSAGYMGLGRGWKKDDSRIVIDEVGGMAISLLWVPFTLGYFILAFLLFRFFDIVKPLGIKTAERLPGGWGVMGDDVLAGIYTCLVIQLWLFTNG